MDSAPHRAPFWLGGWLVEPSLDRITRCSEVEHLRPKLMDLLVFLAESTGKVQSKDEIIEKVWQREFITESVLSRSVSDLRQLLHDDKDNPRFIETVSRRGYRLIAPVRWDREAVSPAPRQPSIAVLPFLDLNREKEAEYFCDGLAEELTNELAHLTGVRVVARTSAFAFKGKAVDIRDIGRQLNVTAVLEGSVQRAHDRIRIVAQLIDTSDGYHLWSGRFDRAAGDIFAIQDEVTRAVVDALRVKLLPNEEATMFRRRTENLEAHDLYLRGCYVAAQRTADAYSKAIRYFERASSQDPLYLFAHAALSACYCGSGFLGYLPPREAFPKAKTAANRALALDPAFAPALAALGWVNWAYEWDWLAAERHLTRAEELSPNDAMARFWHALLLAALGRFDAALIQIDRAWDLDPLSLVIQTNVGLIRSYAGQYDEAVERFRNVLAMDPAFALASFHLGRVYLAMERLEEAISSLEAASAGFPLAMGFLSLARAAMGEHAEARKILGEMERLSQNRYVGPVSFALAHLGLGDIEIALDWLEKAIDEHEGVVPLFSVEPCMKRLRSNPRFAELLTRLKYPLDVSP